MHTDVVHHRGVELLPLQKDPVQSDGVHYQRIGIAPPKTGSGLPESHYPLSKLVHAIA